MRRALIILAVVLPFAAGGILLSRGFPSAVLWYIALGLLLVEITIRLTSEKLGGIQHWTIEAVWIPYHCFLIYLLGRLLNFSEPALVAVTITVPLVLVGFVAATAKARR